MRHQPALVDAVAREAAAEMIVDAALGDLGEGEVDRLERIGESEAEARAPQQPEELRLGKFRRAPDAAFTGSTAWTRRGARSASVASLGGGAPRRGGAA